MKTCAKLLAGCLLVAMLLTLFACSGKKTPSGSETGTSKETGTQTEEITTEEYRNDVADLPENLDFDGETFTIRSIVQQAASREFEAEMNGTVIDQAVYNRNRAIEETYDCVIVNNETVGNTNNHDMLNEVQTMVDGGLYNNQILVTAGYRMLESFVNGLLVNVRTMEGINLEKDYYSQGHNEALSYGNAQYAVTGRMSMSFYRYMVVMLYNRSIFKNYDVEDPFDLVLDQQWTFEKAAEIASKILLDTGDENTSTYGFIGFVGKNSSQTDGFMSSADLHVLGKNEDGSYKLDVDTEKFASNVDKILKLLYSSGSYVSTSIGNNGVKDRFTTGTAGMIAFRLYVVEDSEMINLGNTGLGYGILPLPKADEDQDDYISYVQDQCFLFSFPKSLPEEMKQKVGWFFEAYASDSYEVTKSTYYERALTLRYLSDVKSKQVMEIIDSHVYVDPVNVYLSTSFSFTTGRLRYVYADPSTTSVTNLLATYVTGGDMQERIDKLNGIFEELNGQKTE